MTVEIYSDVACPWCYVGERRFARALATFPQADRVEVVFRPYQLDPTLPETPRPLTESLRRKFGPRLDATLRQTAAAARQEGLDLRFEDALAVNTLTAHRLLRFALERGGPNVQRALAEQLFEAHFTHGRNVADHTVLADLAEAVGLDRDDALVYLGVGGGEAKVQAEIAEAHRLGVRAVPTFVFDGRTAVQGAQPTSTFLQALEDLLPEEMGQEPETAPGSTCDDGACAPR